MNKNQAIMLETLFNKVTDQTIMLTPNRRLALWLTREYDNFQQAANKKSWSTLTALPLAKWLEQLWIDANSNNFLLTEQQQLCIWERIITESKVGRELLNITATAREVKKAWQLLREWQIDLQSPLFALSEDYAAFKKWAQQFSEYCKAKGFIESSQLPSVNKSQQLILVGFDQLAPLYQNFFSELQQNGSQIEHFDPNSATGVQYRVAFTDQEQEIVNMALWAKNCLHQNPAAKIGCVIAELNSLRTTIEYYFQKINGNLFDISGGKRLIDFPLVYDALLFLKTGKVPKHSRVFTQGSSAQPQSVTKEKNCIPSEWSNIVTKILTNSGWLSDYQLIVGEEQIIVRWNELLVEFSALNLVVSSFSYKEAIEQLFSMASQIIFQPKTQDKPIRVLGLLEAAGLNFDYLWVMGVTDKNWPPPPHPNPFLPIQLQRKLQLPRSTAEKELSFYRALTERFKKSATKTIFSYPQFDRDYQLRASNLIQDITPIFATALKLTEFTLYPKSNLSSERITDTKAPAVTGFEVIRGGASILKLQALCPFSAFAKCRLAIKEPKQELIALSAAERGSLLHLVLEKLWTEVVSQEQLNAYPAPQLDRVVAKCVTTACKEFTVQLTANNNSIPKSYLTLEKRRLHQLVTEWLNLEKQRPTFTVVSAEQWLTCNIAGIEVKLRIDRVDKLADNSLLVLDYKTGAVSEHGWEGDRPEEPQLPLYCISSNSEITGVAFAQLKTGKIQFCGISAAQQQIPGIKTTANWSAILSGWRQVLQTLATEFTAGEAIVAPKNPHKTCRNCGLQSFCRINEQQDE